VKGEPAYTNLGSAELQFTPEVMINGEYVAPGAVGAAAALSWSNNFLDLSSLESVSKVRLSFVAGFRLDQYTNAYSVQSVVDDTKFVVRQWNVPSRTRRIHANGSSSTIGKNAKKPEVLLCEMQGLILDLSEFSGELELQPLVLATRKMHDRLRSSAGASIDVQKSSILGWTDPLTIILDRARKGVDSLFEFRWVSFKDDGVPGLRESEYFALRWQARPILYLNSDIDGLQDVLTCEDKIGKRARARDAINSTIAHQCLSVAIATSIYAAREINFRSQDPEPESVQEQLSALERLVLREWIHVLDPASNGHKSEWEESLVRLLLMEEDEVQRAVADHLPQSLQVELGSTKAVSELLKTFMERTVEA